MQHIIFGYIICYNISVMNKHILLYILGASICAAGALFADVTLPRYFTDNMVLQRDAKVPIFGKAEPGEKVKVSFAGQALETVADKSGEWEVTLSPLSASTEGQVLTVGTNTYTNILVGDVWIFAGNGRIDGTFRRTNDPDAAEFSKVVAEQPNVRLATVANNTEDYPAMAYAYKEKFLGGPNRWKLNTDHPFQISLYPFAFADKMANAKNVPVGVISTTTSWGGPDNFVSAKALRETDGLEYFSQKVDSMLPETEIGLKVVNEFIEKYENWYKTTAAELAAGKGTTLGAVPKYNHLKDSGFCGTFNAMLYPLRRMPAKGVIVAFDSPPQGRDREISKYDLRIEAMKRGISEVFGGIDVKVVFLEKGGMIAQGRTLAEQVP